MAQITITLSKLTVLFKGLQGVLLEDYCKLFHEHYEELEIYVQNNKPEIQADESFFVVSVDHENIQITRV